MTYARPSYADLNARIEVDLAALPAVLREPLRVMWSRIGHGMHGMLEWILAQCSPLTCEEERLYDWAALYGVPRLLARDSTGQALATGAIGASILADTQLRGSNGLNYLVRSAVTLGAGQTGVNLICETAGDAGNLPASAVLTLIDPLTGVDSDMTVDIIGLTGGAEIETVDAWRLRVADEWQTLVTRGARSGKPEDYRAWAKAAHQDVTTALVQLHALGIGTVLVRPICNGLPNRQPTQAVLDAVAEQFADRAPGGADWRVAAPIIHLVTPTLHLLPGFDTAGNRTAIASALNSTILAEIGETSQLLLAEVDGAVQAVTDQYTRVSPVADVTVGAGEILVLGGITW